MKITRCAGVSLIEVMLGVAIGLGVISTAGVAYHTQHQSWLLMQAIASLHHNANAALDHVQTSAQIADAANLEGTGEGIVKTLDLPILQGDIIEGYARSDRLALSHFSALDGYDCQGNHVDKHMHIRDSYQVNSKLELTCKDNQLAGSTYQAIAEGVEDFQLQFAEHLPATTTDGASLWQWKQADQISVFTNVMAIEVCLRMVSTQPVQTPASAALGCQGEPLASDGKLRRVFRRVVAIRSHMAFVLP
jgi:hypothetical protein